ncbi:LysR family transcriptional regulator protein [Azotobacter vinelandii CA]|uniref:LysR family transcriptional regulator protein n=2 Tax=Azotobacter vinelandii TaxID=354 RepID=C1DJJ7_AZOVD|nr:LysR family transcriptional regulator [Azotobacter vinelandii]ACO78766.1 LysR family transcriptional regulator protein [Azotobacter vinelandii DJ]AGK14914.1 LysR family transcriptional regulator protein [Azotobacter vinelandii CA]AGK20730.1 LysR family transcriptional regulator protein [Azotobacter vinelandii CA6]WKN19714.1 LysR family transcriptional regulator [Azotobacter vinelandii]SFX32930.1 transcriptional regulator, LysR family [Azotobacter vinelandii]
MPAFTRAELADLNVFMTIVRRRSFRQSAVELGVTTSALSHAMKNLESRLGVKLLNRTSRSVVPTQAGSALAERLEQGFQTIAEALAELDTHRDAPVGRLRLNVPRDASRLLLGPVLPGFFARYPELQLEVAVEDRMVDIVADGFDAGIRYGGTVPRDMIAMPLTGELRWIVVASPDYLSHHGRPRSPEDLLRHQCMRIRLGDNTPYKWELGDAPRAIHLDVPGSLGANETDILLQATLDGLGLSYCLELRVAEELRSGRLEVVLPEWSSMGPPFCMYYPSRRQSQPGLRQLIESIRALEL